jgi:DNA mismatch repair ATPase MutS
MRLRLLNNVNGATDHDLTWCAQDVIRDLDLGPVLEVMGGGDEFVKNVCKEILLNGAVDGETVVHRQQVLKDSVKNKTLIADLYSLLTRTMEEARRQLFWVSDKSPASVVFSSVRVLETYFGIIDQVRDMLTSASANFESEGFKTLIHDLEYHMGRDYTNAIRRHLSELRLEKGVHAIVRLGKAAEFAEFTLSKQTKGAVNIADILAFRSTKEYKWTLPERDESGGQEMEYMRNRILERVAGVLKSATDDVLDFMSALRKEVAFCVGCMNLWDNLSAIGVPLSFPNVREQPEYTIGFSCLSEVSFALRSRSKPVCNSLRAEGKALFIISGANRGGKTVFLRSIGQALLMMWCGMFVAAENFECSLPRGVYTHFKREEDKTMTMGKLDEELARLSAIIDHVSKGSVVLFNESFSSTYAREASEIAGQVVAALVEKGVKLFFVTHLYELVSLFRENTKMPAVFLSAERKEDGARTFRILEATPPETSFAGDVYAKVFGEHNTDLGGA